MSKSIKDAKKQLRLLVKSQLSNLSQSEIASQSRLITHQLVEMSQFKQAQRIGLYMNMPLMEAQTGDLIQQCFNDLKEVYLPKCVSEATEDRKRNHLNFLKVPTYQDVLSLEPQGPYKLLEPTTGVDILSTDGFDLIIVPGVAFTKHRERIGHGAGFYDEFLGTYYKKFGSKPTLIGIGLNQQLVEHIPKEEHDWDLDALVIGDIGIF